MPLLYSELAAWYPLLDPVEDHAQEAAVYLAQLTAAAPGARSLLELGAGAGNNAFHLKARFDCTLTDLSPEMLALSRRQNPGCEHAPGDMRTLRLGRTFDLVLAHDALSYVTTEADLRATAQTAFEHLGRGGVALFQPDTVKETFRERSELHGGDDETRALRALEWSWDPDPTDQQCLAEFVFVLREAGQVRTVHDRHVEGLFARATWADALTAAGFEVLAAQDHLVEDGFTAPYFLARRP
jgi:SAM-dependent methyltransferase